MDARACVFRDLDARSRHTKSARKIASYVLKLFGAVESERGRILGYSTWMIPDWFNYLSYDTLPEGNRGN